MSPSRLDSQDPDPRRGTMPLFALVGLILVGTAATVTAFLENEPALAQVTPSDAAVEPHWSVDPTPHVDPRLERALDDARRGRSRAYAALARPEVEPAAVYVGCDTVVPTVRWSGFGLDGCGAACDAARRGTSAGSSSGGSGSGLGEPTAAPASDA